jgi:hypothetical protein
MTRSSPVPKSTEITNAEVQELLSMWYQKLDDHAPFEEIAPCWGDEPLKMVLPEGTLNTLSEIRQWYSKVINLFFDEVHTLKTVTTILKGDRAEVKIVVKWEASRWTPPAARSERIIADAHQTWEVARSPHTGKVVILAYVVNSLEYHEGSARLKI